MRPFLCKLKETSSSISAFIGIGLIIANIGVSSDAFQKSYVKAKLRQQKVVNPRFTIISEGLHFIKRDDDLKLLETKLLLNARSERWVMVGNPQGFGKSSLLKEFGSRYKGPVLFTDFHDVKEPSNVENKLHDTIAPLFFNTYPLTILADKSFNHRLAILKEVAKELADEGKPIFWIMDSFSTLVSNAVAKDAAPGSIANYKGVISQIFSLTSVLIPVPVCSSATTAGALADVNAHVWVRTRPFFAPFVSDENELKKYVKSVILKRGQEVIGDDVIQDIVDTAGSNFVELERLAISSNPTLEIENLVQLHTLYLRKLKTSQKGAYDLLAMIVSGAKVNKCQGDDDHMLLLSRHPDIDAFCCVHPNGHLILAMPVTKKALSIIEQEVLDKQMKMRNVWWPL